MKYLTRASKRARNEDHGLAIASVAILGAFLVVVTVVVMLRSMTEQTLTRDDRLYEQSLHTAEASVDYALAEFTSDPVFNTTHTSLAVDTKDEVIAAAIDIYNAPGSGIPQPVKNQAVHETGEGVSIVVKPFDADIVYGVGFSPSVESYQAGTGKVRVVVSELGPPYWSPKQAVLVGGPVKIEAKKNDKDIDLTCSDGAPDGCTAEGGWVHSNGKIEFKVDKDEDNITGCFTAYGLEDTVTKKNGDPRKSKNTIGPYTNNDDSAYPYCPDQDVQDTIVPLGFEHDGKIPYIPIPEIDPMAVHGMAQFEVCPDGLRWGPNAASADGIYPASSPDRSIEGFPCTGDLITSPITDGWVLGLKNADEDDKPGSDSWDKRVEFDKNTEDGIYFLWGRSAKMKKLKGEGDRYWTIIAAHGDARYKAVPNQPVVNDLTCLGKDDVEVWNPDKNKWEDISKELFGDVEVEVENDDIFPYGWTGNPADPGEGRGYLIVTAGDVKVKVKGKKNLGDPGDIHGVIAAHEQVRVESSDADDGKGAIYGVVIAQDACDTRDSLHKDKMSEFKKGDIIYNGDFQTTDFVLEDVANGEYRLISQNEM